MRNEKNRLYRYTSLPVLLHVLRTQTLTLLDPKTWEDKNDTHFLEKYRQLSDASTVLAICFTRSSERFHHWKVFSGDMGGVCIEFYRDRLLAHFPLGCGLLHGPVTYRTVKHLKNNSPAEDKLPFLKRVPYKDEEEYRIIFRDDQESPESKSFPIDLSCIARIQINPWIPLPLVAPLKDTIKSVDGCKKLKIYKTTLLENEDWKSVAERTG